MARITKVGVTYGGKLNMGNYESADITIYLEAEIADGDSPKAVMDSLWETAKQAVRSQAAPIIKARTERNNIIFTGLPADVREELH